MDKGKCDDENKYQHNATMLIVFNLEESVSDEDLYEHFNQFPGLVVWCKRAHSCGFVNYSNPEQAANAINLVDSTLLNNNPISVLYSPSHRDIEESFLSIMNLDKSVDKTTLYGLFSKHGKILDIQVDTDASGLCSGSALVYYNCFASAQTAIEHLDGALIYNKPLQIHPMRNHHRKTNPELLSVLFSSHSSASISHLRKFFTTYGPIASVSEYTHHKGDRFGFVTFENPEDAARAARDAPNHKIFNRHFKLYGKYADAADMLDGDQVDLKQLHVSNLDKAITDHSLKALFFTFGCLFSCKVLRDLNGTSTGSGLVAFATNKEASTALRAMNGEMILGKTLRITLEKRRESRPRSMLFMDSVMC